MLKSLTKNLFTFRSVVDISLHGVSKNKNAYSTFNSSSKLKTLNFLDSRASLSRA